MVQGRFRDRFRDSETPMQRLTLLVGRPSRGRKQEIARMCWLSEKMDTAFKKFPTASQ
jgi:hypothetical protein